MELPQVMVAGFMPLVVSILFWFLGSIIAMNQDLDHGDTQTLEKARRKDRNTWIVVTILGGISAIATFFVFLNP